VRRSKHRGRGVRVRTRSGEATAAYRRGGGVSKNWDVAGIVDVS
jgi:hypothetical protein